MGIKNIVENVQKRGLKDILDPNVWKTYADYKEIEENGIYLTVDDIIPFAEQLVYRLGRCSKCLEAGKCVGYETRGCSCSFPAKALPPAAECAEDRWIPMMDGPQWSDYKKEKNIEIIIVQP